MGLWSDIFGSSKDTELGRQIGELMLKDTLESRQKDVFKIPTWDETLDVEKYSRLIYKTAVEHNMGRGQINRMVSAMAAQMEYNGLPHNRVKPFHRQVMEIVMQYVNNPPTK